MMKEIVCLVSISIVGFLSFLSCNGEKVENSESEFLIQDGFEVKIIAGDELLDTPVGMAFDWDGSLWVVELPGYMRDIDGSNENVPDGKIVRLEDQDGDGVMDQRVVFLDNLQVPRALALVYNGLLYSEGTNLRWISRDKQENILVDSLYVIGGNIEHQPNGLLYNLDNWIYSANSNVRYRYRDGKWEKQLTSFRGQWGISQDDAGRLYYNNNGLTLVTDFLAPDQLIENVYWKPVYGNLQILLKDTRLFPIQATSVNRGYQKGVLDAAQKVKNLTSACSPFIYRANQFPEAFYGNGFVCAPEANLLKRYVLEEEGARLKAQLAYESEEFLISKDETFRPINLYTGFDGQMYIVDLHKGVIQHRAYMTSYLRDQIKDKGLDTIVGQGRILAVRNKANALDDYNSFDAKQPKDLIRLLGHPNGALRRFAQQQLIADHRVEVKEEIRKLALYNVEPRAQIQALWTLEGLGALDWELIKALGAKTNDPDVWVQLLRLEGLVSGGSRDAFFELAFNQGHAKIDLQLCHSLGAYWSEPTSQNLWVKLAQRYGNNLLFSEALVSGVEGVPVPILNKLETLSGVDSLNFIFHQVQDNQAQKQVQAPQWNRQVFEDNRTRGFRLYSKHCASCHGMDGTGIAVLAPPLLHSEYLHESADRLTLLLLHGLEGPVTVNGQTYKMNAVMPGFKDNPELGDEALADLMVFINNAFSLKWMEVDKGRVSALRALTKDRKKLFTEEELKREISLE